MTIRQNHSLPPPPGQSIDRSSFLLILQTAFACGEYRFTRQAALHWLAAFPGDLQVSQTYAQALLGEQRTIEARQVLKGLCQIDPEDDKSVKLWLTIEQTLVTHPDANSQNIADKTTPGRQPQMNILPDLQNWLAALNGQPLANLSETAPGIKSLPTWGDQLFFLRKKPRARRV